MTETIENLRQPLEAGMGALGLPVQARCSQRLLAYLELLQHWNRAYNLTAVRDPRDMVTRHLLDSLAIAGQVHGLLVDVGSGAGLPAVPLAILRPERNVIAVDKNGKRARFLRAVVRELRLENLDVVEARVDAWHPLLPEQVTIASRAFARLARFMELTAHLGGAQARWLAMKAKLDEDELTQIPTGFAVTERRASTVPGLASERHVVVLTRTRVEAQAERI